MDFDNKLALRNSDWLRRAPAQTTEEKGVECMCQLDFEPLVIVGPLHRKKFYSNKNSINILQVIEDAIAKQIVQTKIADN